MIEAILIFQVDKLFTNVFFNNETKYYCLYTLCCINRKSFLSFKLLISSCFSYTDYIGFIKKALVLLRAYPVIKRVELEVQQTHEPSPDDEESLPPISMYNTFVFHVDKNN